jgi:3-oxoacyl-[acyl-carrier protein] reductase
MSLSNSSERQRVAIVTGSGSPTGIGIACAKALARDGAHVVIASTTARIFDRVDELHRAGCSATGFVGDLSQTSTAEALVAMALDVNGTIDVCVNNAGMTAVGIPHETHLLEQTSDDEWFDSWQRNMTTCFAVTRSVLPHMKRQRYGRIINVASVSGPLQAFLGDPGYHSSKAAMIGFTRSVALEAASFGVTVNAVAPGWIYTDAQPTPEGRAGRLTPVGRSGTTDEVGAAVRFLASPEASFIVGQMLVVDGGNSLPEDRSWVATASDAEGQI